MGERFAVYAATAASGTNKTLWNLFRTEATPTSRTSLYDFMIGSVATPADQSALFAIGRSTAVGTEGSGFTPVNLDPGGPAGDVDAGIAHSAEPTYTSAKELFAVPVNQRVTARWVAAPGGELKGAATQNAGMGLYTKSSTSTQAYSGSCWFYE